MDSTSINAEIQGLLADLAKSDCDWSAHFERWPRVEGLDYPGGVEQRDEWTVLCRERERIHRRFMAIARTLNP